MNDLALVVDLHREGSRQGPGGDDETRLAITFSGLRGRKALRVADIGCGTGASTLVLARELDATVTAVDLLPEFLRRLESAAIEAKLTARIETLAASMDELPFADHGFDAIWSEGAIYNMGFERGVRAWRRFLKPGGILAVSELSWLTHERPAELDEYWRNAYPEVATASSKLATLEANGYAPIAYFSMPEHCWLEHYYRPLQSRFAAFLARHDHSVSARSLVAAEEREIALSERNRHYVSYGYYVARKTIE